MTFANASRRLWGGALRVVPRVAAEAELESQHPLAGGAKKTNGSNFRPFVRVGGDLHAEVAAEGVRHRCLAQPCPAKVSGFGCI